MGCRGREEENEKMSEIGRKFSLIMWKNLLIRKRHWILTIFEVLVPIMLFLLLAYIRGIVPDLGQKEHNETTTFPPQSMKSLIDDYSTQITIYYAPNEPFHQVLMESVKRQLKIPTGLIQGFSSEAIMDFNITEHAEHHRSEQLVAITFDNSTLGSTPKNLKYTIRTDDYGWDTQSLFPVFQYPGPMRSQEIYFRSSFIILQMALDSAYAKIVSNKSYSDLPYDLELQAFPYPPYIEEMGIETIFSIAFPVITVFSFMFLVPAVCKRVVEEKQTGIKELMKLMGLKPWMLWIGWFCHALVTYLVSVTVIVILLKMSWSNDSVPLVELSNPFLLWIYFMLYTGASICVCFFISSLFNRPTFAMSVGSSAWLLSYFIPNKWSSAPKLNLIYKLLLCLFPNTAIVFGFRNIATLETRKVGLHFGNLFEKPSNNSDDISVGGVFLMLIADMIIYGVLTWYIDSIKPGHYGLAKPWYFPFTVEYWVHRKVENSNETGFKWSDVKNYEEPSSHLTPGIKIRNLRKEYGSKHAVDGLTMDYYKGEITALLGHNGAGKTTTMSILTGLFSPTSGNVTINDYNLRTQLSKIREDLGLCPQHNMLFTDLTVMEHLRFFSKLKGASCREADNEAKKILDTLHLSNKSSNMPNELSGGMQRKLSLAIALVGNSKVLMLDEPTSGMDPEARRAVWDILLQMRHPEKTIIITTHFMEEADVLGDRIAIMDHGQLKCYGTSMYLKNKYGAGYQLSIMRTSTTNIAAVTDFIASHIPEVKLKNQNPTLLTYELPTSQNDKLGDLFKSLEHQKASLEITGVGLSVTTLEEVFLRVGQLTEEESPEKKNNFTDDMVDGSHERLLNDGERTKGIALECDRFKALLIKKCIYTKRKYLFFVISSIIPILLAIALVRISGADESNTDEIALDLKLDIYGNNKVFYTQSDSEITKFYAKSLPENVGAPVTNVTDEILITAKNNIIEYREMLLIAAEFTQKIVRAMYSTIPLHSLPISWNILSNAVLKSLMGDSYSISAVNKPLDMYARAELNVGPVDQKSIEIIMAWVGLFPMALMFCVGGYVNFPLTERVSKAKQLQLMTGLEPYTYWFSCYIFDLVCYLVIAILTVLCIGLFDPTHIFDGRTELILIFTIVFLYGFSGIVYSYVVSLIRPTIPGSFSFLIMTNTVLTIGAAVVYGMIISGDKFWEPLGEKINFILSLIPHYTLAQAILKFTKRALDNNKCHMLEPEMREYFCISSNSVMKECCALNCPKNEKCSESMSYLSGDDKIGFHLVMFFVDGIFWFVVIFLCEYLQHIKWKDLLYKPFAKGTYSSTGRRDSDVETEALRVDNCLNKLSTEEDNLLVRKLVKRYGLKHFAVKGVSFGVHSGECFGLLGVNGAGKTTTFKMLTGDEVPTSGDAMADRYRLSKHRNKYLSQFGYCPQFDAINESLTGKEMLYVFARLRGVPTNKLAGEVSRWLYYLGLREYQDRLCGTYSGGNKRKLSTAMALIGEPPIVLLDEPTSGVDPISRRNLWNVLSKIQKQSIVLTSHSMEECEALCNRLAIMVNGQFCCVGTVQYLKQRFGQGYTVIMKIKSESTETAIDNLKSQIQQKFQCEIKDEHEGLLHYHVTDPTVKWFELFNGMEKIKKDSNGLIEDYTVSETTLEQVFLSFARLQNNNPEEEAYGNIASLLK